MWRIANFRHKSAYCIRFMHEVVPKVVATAVRIVMTRCRIFWMISFFIVMSFEFFIFPLSRGLGVCDTHKWMHSNTPPSPSLEGSF